MMLLLRLLERALSDLWAVVAPRRGRELKLVSGCKDTSKPHPYSEEPNYFLPRGIARQRYEAVAAQAELIRLAVRNNIW